MPHAHAVLLTSLPAEITQQIASLAPGGFVTTILSNRVPDAEKIAALHDADFLLIHPGDIAERVLRAAPKLRLIQLLRAGYELMNTALLKELGIPFAIIGDAMSGLVADHAVLLMLAVYRNLVLSDTGVKAGRWDAAIRGRKAYAMDGKSVGILGMGHIGTQVARRVQGFGCAVQYHSRHALPADEERRLGARYVGLRDLCATSDIVSLHVPLTPATRHLVGRAELRLMQRSAILVNTSRGAVIDEAALIEALQGGWITGAGLDVFDPQPPKPDNPLLQFDNVVLTPHSASVTLERWPRTAQFAWHNVQNVWEGKPPQALVI